MGNRRLRASQALLALLPMLGAAIGAMLDESRGRGFTTWRAACQGAGLRLSTLADFTLQLLPSAVIGLLLGGVLVLTLGMLRKPQFARSCLAAHGACALTLPLTLLLCALLPPAWMLAADALLVGAVAWLLLSRASVRLRTRSVRRA